MSAGEDRLQLILKVATRLKTIQAILAEGALSPAALRQRLVAQLGTDTPQERTIRRDLALLLEGGVVRRHGYTSDALWSLPESAPPAADDDLEVGF